MDFKKLLLVLVASVAISGIVVYRMNSTRRRGAPPPATEQGTQQAPPVTPPTVPVEPAAPGAVPAAVTTSTLPVQPPPVVVQIPIPQVGWGRNPFLTPEEIAKLNTPPVVEIPKPPVVVEVPVPVPVPPPAVVQPEPPPLPAYVVSAIVADKKGSWALIGRKQIRVGDKLGIELVKDITSSGVVLETDGKTRKLPFGLSAAGSSEGFSLSSDGRLENRK